MTRTGYDVKTTGSDHVVGRIRFWQYGTVDIIFRPLFTGKQWTLLPSHTYTFLRATVQEHPISTVRLPPRGAQGFIFLELEVRHRNFVNKRDLNRLLREKQTPNLSEVFGWVLPLIVYRQNNGGLFRSTTLHVGQVEKLEERRRRSHLRVNGTSGFIYLFICCLVGLFIYFVYLAPRNEFFSTSFLFEISLKINLHRHSKWQKTTINFIWYKYVYKD